MNLSADRRPYLPPRRVFVSVAPTKPQENRRSPQHPLTSSERHSTPPLISSPASLGPASPHTRSSPTAKPPNADGSRTAPTQCNYWSCLHKVGPFDSLPPHNSQCGGHNRVRSAGAAIAPPVTVVTKMHTRAGMLNASESRGIRNPYGFLLAGGNVQTGLAHREATATILRGSAPAFSPEPTLSLPPRSEDDSSTVKTIKRRKQSNERNWSHSLKGVHTGIIKAEKALLESITQVETRVLARVDEQAKRVEERLLSLERQLANLRLCESVHKASAKTAEAATREPAMRRAVNHDAESVAVTTCPRVDSNLEQFQLCSDVNIRRGNSADTLFDNLSEHNRSPTYDPAALLKATEGLTVAVSTLLKRMGGRLKTSDTDDEADFDMDNISEDSSDTSVKVMQVK